MDPIPLTATQQAKLNNLVHSSRIRRVPIDLAKTERFIEQSRAALAELPSIRNNQLRYDGGYNAAHDVGEALMAAYGYRTENGPGQHITLGEVFLILFDGTPAQDAAEDYEHLRIARNQLRYVANPLGKVQADATVSCAETLLRQAQLILKSKPPSGWGE